MTKGYHYTETCRFNELHDVHQMAIADVICTRIKASKVDVMKRILNVSNPELHYNLTNDRTRMTSFQFSDKTKEVLQIALRNYIHEAL